MMKEIKYRAYSKRTKKVYHVLAIFFYQKVVKLSKICGSGISFLEQIDDVVLMQYTGLEDKDDVEICEGDYVVGVQYMTTSPNVPFEINGVVRYSERNTMFYIDDKNKGHDMFMHSLGSTPYILGVIGNIYENKDLLEG